MEQIKVEPLDNNHDDLFVVNAARVSFNKWKDTLDPTDTGLIGYLAREQHSSPFRHVRMAIAFRADTMLSVPNLNFLNPFDRAGLVMAEVQWQGDAYLVMKHSLFGWANLILNCGRLYSQFFNTFVCHYLHERFPISAEKLGVPNPVVKPIDLQGAYVLNESALATLDQPWLVDMSFRCEVPLWLSRQLAKHQVGMSWNEVSRRYVSDTPELFNQEFRTKPDGSIKQGSGLPVRRYEVPDVEMRDGGTYLIQDICLALRNWYDECIDDDIAPETVRGFMPQNMMTQFIWSGPLPAWAHLVNLRSEGHAQKEAQDFAQKLNHLIQAAHPELWASITK